MSTTTAIPAAPAGVEAFPGCRRPFVVRLGDISSTPVGASSGPGRAPLPGIDALHAAMVATVDQAAEAEQLGPDLRPPELAGREAAARHL